MATMNTKQMGVNKGARAMETVSHEGGQVYNLSPKIQFLRNLFTNFWGEPSFYNPDGNTEAKRTLSYMKAVIETDPLFFVKSLFYARHDMKLRTVPVVGLSYLATYPENLGLFADWAPRILTRADQPGEAIAAYWVLKQHTGRKRANLPVRFRRGIERSLYRFDEYQFRKYQHQGGVKLVDVLNLVHPNPAKYAPMDKSGDYQDIFKRMANGGLGSADTWEVNLSAAGDPKEKWETEINKIRENKFPYMAALRNIRNVLKARVSNDHMKLFAGFVSDPKAVRKGKQLPFRYISAYKAVDYFDDCDPFAKREMLNAIEEAADVAAENIPLEGRTAVLVDISSSMTCNKISSRSDATCADISTVLGSMLAARGGLVVAFATGAKILHLDRRGILAGARHIWSQTNELGYGTDGHIAIQELLRTGTHVDRFILLSDEQIWNTHRSTRQILNKYRVEVNHDVWLHSVNLKDYGNSVVPEADKNVNLLGGWSERIFDFILATEKGEGSIIEAIERIE